MSIASRAFRAVRGEVALFEEVEHDARATVEAVAIVVTVSAATSLGGALRSMAATDAPRAILVLALGVVVGLISWALFAAATYAIGEYFFGAKATWGEMLRTLGYAASPLLLAGFAFVPLVGGILGIVGLAWSIYLGFLAVRSALDVSSAKAVVTILLAIIPPVALNVVLYQPVVSRGGLG